MDKKAITLLKALSDKASDAQFKEEIGDVIKELNLATENKDRSGSKVDKKTAFRILEVVGNFFVRIGSNMVAKELLELLHHHLF